MKIRIKLALAFAAIPVFLIASGLVAQRQFSRIEKNIATLAEVKNPLEDAAFEMETSINETSGAVLDYVRELDRDHLERVIPVVPI